MATAWAWVYGLIYLALGAVLVPFFFNDNPPGWAICASVSSIVIGFLFSVVAVDLIPYSRERRLIKRLASIMPTITLSAADTQCPPDEQDEKRMLHALARIGDRSSYLVSGHGDAAIPDLALTPAGERVLRNVLSLIEKRKLELQESATQQTEPPR